MKLPHDRLQQMVARIFAQAGCHEREAGSIAAHLVDSNLVGHDSHGVIRVVSYVAWIRQGKVVPNQSLKILFENDALAMVDGSGGFGQVIGEQAVELGIAKSARSGVAVVALRNSGHLGRIGDWAEQAARGGRVSLHLVNTNGAGLLVAPFGGIDRRLSADPIAVGVPRDRQPPIVLDISTCAIAEGKIRVAFNKGVSVPEGAIIDSQGQPTTDPRIFYGQPPGAILPMGGHKGYGLAVMAELLAGALGGNGCTRPGVPRLANGMLSIYLDPNRFVSAEYFRSEIDEFVEFVKSSRTVTPGGEILMPGELEHRHRQARMVEGIQLDDTTWGQLADTWRAVGLEQAELEATIGTRMNA